MSAIVAILFSGQGGQHRDMFRMLGTVPEAEPVFAAAARVLGSDPRVFVRDAEEAALFSNRTGQILCCTQALAAWAMLGDARPSRAVLAGYSVGELASWGCAGFFTPGQILELAAGRADAMDRATPVEAGLAAIVGLSRRMLEPVLALHDIHVAIVNGSDSFVVGGLGTALDACLAEARRTGATTAKRLAVAVPSHTPLLKDASVAFGEIVHRQPIGPATPGMRLLSGIDGDTVRNPQLGLDKLCAQISQTVEWRSCLEFCLEAGATSFLELGPGSALARMAEALPDGPPARSVEQFRSPDGVRDWLKLPR